MDPPDVVFAVSPGIGTFAGASAHASRRPTTGEPQRDDAPAPRLRIPVNAACVNVHREDVAV